MFPKITNIEYDDHTCTVTVQYLGRIGTGRHSLFAIALYMAMLDLWVSM